jgi:hypothetical protein
VFVTCTLSWMKISQILSLSLPFRRAEERGGSQRFPRIDDDARAHGGEDRCRAVLDHGSSSITGEGDAHGLARAAWMASASGLGNMMIENDEKNRYCGIFL